jgi:hypothetical protein
MKYFSIFILMSLFIAACGGNGGGKDTAEQDVIADTQKDTGTDAQETTPVDNTPVDTGKDTTPVDTGPDFAKDTQVTDTTPKDTAQLDSQVISTCSDIVFYCMILDKPDCTSSMENTDEVKKYNALIQCMDANKCSDVFENDLFSACVESKCAAERKACLSGSLTCKEVYKCRKDCPPTDDDVLCPEKCLSKGAVEDQTKFTTFKSCLFNGDCAKDPEKLMDNGWPEWDCENWINAHECPLQYQNCIPPV